MKKIGFCEKDDRIDRAIQVINSIGIHKTVLITPKVNEDYVNQLVELRKHKGMTTEQARELLKNTMYYSCMELLNNKIDILIAGATWETKETLKPALEIIKGEFVSSFFYMKRDKKVLLFADCAINIAPDAQQLAKIAIQTYDSAIKLDMKNPKVALLSFSTKSDFKEADKVKEALNIIRSSRPEIIVDGELQADVALNQRVSIQKNSKIINGDANILIFPNLVSANIGYKLVQELGYFQAIGPVIQGLNKQVHDLSRGCSYKDIIDLVTISLKL